MPALIELQPETAAGARLVECAESIAPRLGENAERYDANGHYPIENVGLLEQAGFFTAPIPERFGGGGVDSLHDLLIACSRLARHDASTTLGVNMHLVVVTNMVRRWEVARHRGLERRAAAYAGSLEQVVAERRIIAAAISEPNQDLTHPGAYATRNERGWILTGNKIFCTMSPAATILLTSVTYSPSEDQLLYGYAEVPVESPGVIIHDDWDSLGMRTSGSNSVTFQDVQLPDSALRGGFPVGSATGYIERNLANGLFHASAAVGIAESAHTISVRRLGGRITRGLCVAEQMLMVENAVALSALRATFGRAARLMDAFHQRHLTDDASSDDLHSAFAEGQAAKAFICSTAATIVDRALTLSGGAGYMRGHPLERAYRDVRAGAFMQPLGYARAHEYLAQVMLGLEPTLA